MGFINSTKTAIKRYKDSSSHNSSRNTSPSNSASNSPRIHDKEKFYRAQIGDCFYNKYVVRKYLGSGRYSSVWLVQNTETSKTAAMKILNSDFYNGRFELFELEVMQKVSNISAQSTHPGRNHVAQLLDHFDILGPTGKHVCLVMPLLGTNIADQATSGHLLRLPSQTVKQIAKQMLEALDFMHVECGVIHTDIQPSNILQDLQAGPQAGLAETKSDIQFCLNDLGLACFTDRHLTDRIQSPYLRPPEIILEAPWDPSVDTYSLGCLLYQFITGDLPFTGRSATGRTVEQDRLATLVSLFGPVPDVVLNNAARTKEFEQANVDLTGTGDKRAGLSLEHMVGRCAVGQQGLSEEDVPVFCDLLRQMLATDPRRRISAGELLQHPWLSDT